MKQSKRKIDIKRTNRLQKLTDYMLQRAGYTISRKNDTTNQLDGIDIVLHKDNKTLLVDEKAAITAWDRDLQTFSMEIRTLNNNKHEGWLFNHKLRTTHYAFLFPRAYTEDMCQIYQMEILIVSKQAIMNYLKTYQCHTKQTVFFRIDNFGFLENGAYRYHVSEDIQIIKSINLKEQPTCILINRKILREIATDIIIWGY